MEVVELLGMVGIDDSGLWSAEKCRRDDGLIHLHFDIHFEAVTIPYVVLQPAEGLVVFGDPVGNLITDSGAVGKCVSQIGKITHDFGLVAVDIDSRRSSVLRVGERLVRDRRFVPVDGQSVVGAPGGEEVHAALRVHFGRGIEGAVVDEKQVADGSRR
ncbi:hypothetical protein SprV_0200911500 [Sparganum proliferum]